MKKPELISWNHRVGDLLYVRRHNGSEEAIRVVAVADGSGDLLKGSAVLETKEVVSPHGSMLDAVEVSQVA